MRNFSIFLAFILAACGGNGDGVNISSEPVQHAPQISNLILFPDSALYMEGDGSVVITVEISFRDAGRDIQTLWARMPNGETLEFDKSIATETGTFTEDLTMSTETVGAFDVEFWLVDQAGDSSNHVSDAFFVLDNAQSSEWTNRLTVPLPLLDVAWDGQVFIAVGYGGTILTSVDGIDWVTQASSPDVNIWDDALYAVTTFDSSIYAVGAAGILLSTDHGETWSVKARPHAFIGTAVAANSSQVIVMGTVPDLAIPRIAISQDGGETWQTMTFSWNASDLVYRDGLFVAPIWLFRNGTCVIVSTDGVQWNEIIVREEVGRLDTVVHNESRFFVAGAEGTVFSSFDAYNWTEVSTPLDYVDYLGAASNGTQLILAGRISWNRQGGTDRPIGISSIDSGASWDIFGIDSSYESFGMAWGNGRFVSVGRSALTDEGAVYSTD